MAKYTKPRCPLHPGEILKIYAEDYGITAEQMAEAIAIPIRRVRAVLRGSSSVDVDLALRLARYFDTTPDYWLNMQRSLDLWTAERGPKSTDYEEIPCLKTPAQKREFSKKLKESTRPTPALAANNNPAPQKATLKKSAPKSV